MGAPISAGLTGFIRKFIAIVGYERPYTYVLGDIYAVFAYAFARRAGDTQAGFDFLRLMAHGSSLEQIVAYLNTHYRLVPIEQLRLELMRTIDDKVLSESSL